MNKMILFVVALLLIAYPVTASPIQSAQKFNSEQNTAEKEDNNRKVECDENGYCTIKK